MICFMPSVNYTLYTLWCQIKHTFSMKLLTLLPFSLFYETRKYKKYSFKLKLCYAYNKHHGRKIV